MIMACSFFQLYILYLAVVFVDYCFCKKDMNLMGGTLQEKIAEFKGDAEERSMELEQKINADNFNQDNQVNVDYQEQAIQEDAGDAYKTDEEISDNENNNKEFIEKPKDNKAKNVKKAKTVSEEKSIATDGSYEVDYKQVESTKINMGFNIPEVFFLFIRKYTIFPTTAETLKTRFQPFYPITASLAFIVLTGNSFTTIYSYIPIIIPGILFPLPVCGLTSFVYKKFNTKILILNIPLSLAMTILWQHASANQIVEMIIFISDHYNINMVILGATVLAFGNSLQDYFSNPNMSKKGFGIMAVSGTIAGQLFNLLIGFGLNLVKGCWQSGKVEFNLFGRVLNHPAEKYVIDESGHIGSTMFSKLIQYVAVFHLIILLFLPYFTK